MDHPETEHLLPGGDRVWVIATPEAARLLPNLLTLFRSGKTEPMVFGDAGQPEGVVIPWELWQRFDALAAEEEGFKHLYDITRERLANPEPLIPLEEAAAEIGWDLNEEVDDSEFRKPQ